MYLRLNLKVPNFGELVEAEAANVHEKPQDVRTFVHKLRLVQIALEQLVDNLVCLNPVCQHVARQPNWVFGLDTKIFLFFGGSTT